MRRPRLSPRAPRPGPVPGRLTRRDVLRAGAFAAAGTGAASLLGACGSDSGTGGASSSGDYPLARPDAPVTLPLYDDNAPIEDGLEPEDASVLRILNYADYIAPGVVKDFNEKYGVTIQVTPYNNYDEMLTKLTAPGASFDLTFPGVTVLSRMVYSKLIQPPNQSYLPNTANVWPEYKDPWYDQGAQYTVPYTVFTSGIGYRADRVTDPSEGYRMLWNADYSGEVGVIDDAREALGMAMLAWGITADINTTDPEHINAAKDKLLELVELDVQIDNTQYESIASGKFTVHQAWSGDPIAGRWFLPKGETAEVLGFWQPESRSDRVFGNDLIAIPKSAESPVLAHMFINEILDNEVSLKNYIWNGYQPPLTKLGPEYLVRGGYVPDNLENAVVQPDDFTEGKQFYEQTIAAENAWLAAFQEFQGGQA